MNKVVSFSGGRTSAYLCKIMIDTYGRDNVDFIYMDTGAEHSKTYEFIRKVNDEFGLNLICLRGDFTRPLGDGVGYSVVDIESLKPDLLPFKAMISKYGVPYIGGMFCTDRMKLKPFKKYCDDTYGKNNYETWLGIRADELPRVFGAKLYKKMLELGYENERLASMYSMDIESLSNELVQPHEDDIFHGILKRRGTGLRYMAEISDFDKQDVLNYWSKMSFDLHLDEWSGNCEFCPKKSNLKLAASQRDSPESYINFVKMLHGKAVRIDGNTGERKKMYRGKQSLESLIAKFDGSTGEEIKSRIRGSKMIDTNSCSESCEVFK